jgi:hypothetical protein
MENRRLLTLAGLGLAGMVVLGGCSAAPPAPSGTAGSPVAASRTPAAGAPANQDRAPCTQRLRPGSGGATPMALTPQARAEIERLRALTPEQQVAEGQASAARAPELAARLADVRSRVERATRPCADR